MSTDPSLPPSPPPTPCWYWLWWLPQCSTAFRRLALHYHFHQEHGTAGPSCNIALQTHAVHLRACIFKLALWILQWLVFHLDPDSRCKFVEEWSSNWCARCVHKVQKTFAQNDKNANTGNYIYCTQEKYKSDDVYMSKPAQIESFRVFAGFTRYWDLKPGWYYIKYVWTQ